MNARPAPTGYALVVEATGERHTVDRKLVIGRQSADIALDDLEASRRHATVRPLDDGGVELYDLDSANGTHLNGAAIGTRPVKLQPGDVIRVGRTELRLEQLTSAAERRHMKTVIQQGK